jgi:tRNA threonylcarbamoyladenosine biosynthesis protein TsaB
MKILALEFSSPQRSVAVLREPEMEASEVVEARPGAMRALSMVAESLRLAKLEREEIDCVVVGVGPGSYTGIRAAIALAQGWQLSRGVRLLGISSAECLAAVAVSENMTGRVSCVIDAQRDEFYLVSYELFNVRASNEPPDNPDLSAPAGEAVHQKHSSSGTFSGGWREIEPLHLTSLAEVQERVRAGQVLIGPEVSRWFATAQTVFPRASTLAKLAGQRKDDVAGEKLEPIYLRATNFVKAQPPRLLF